MKQHFNVFLISLFCLSPACLTAQEQQVNTIKTQKTISTHAVDNSDNIYLGFTDGSVQKYDSDGQVLENYALANKSAVTSIDVQNPLKPFLFYFDNQQIVFLDRFSSVPKIYKLSDWAIQFGMLACPAPDGDLWVIENNPQRLKKISPRRKSLVLELQVSLGDSLTKMQAFQNFLLISSKQKLIVMDQFGGEIYQRQFSSIESFQIREQKIFVSTKTELVVLDLVSGRKITSQTVRANKGIIQLKDGVATISDKAVTISKNQ